MSEFRYSEIEREIVAALPELRPAAEHYWRKEGDLEHKALPYVFFDEVFATYVEVLLWLPPSQRRDELLQRAFALVERMLLSADRDVQELAFVGLYEGRDSAWLRLARDFVGAKGRAYLNRWNESWSRSDRLDVRELIQPEIINLHDVRLVVARELQVPSDAGRDRPTQRRA